MQSQQDNTYRQFTHLIGIVTYLRQAITEIADKESTVYYRILHNERTLTSLLYHHGISEETIHIIDRLLKIKRQYPTFLD